MRYAITGGVLLMIACGTAVFATLVALRSWLNQPEED